MYDIQGNHAVGALEGRQTYKAKKTFHEQGGGSAHDLFTGSGVIYKVDCDILLCHCFFLL